MGLGGPVLVVFSCHPLCMPWLCSLSRSHQGCPRGGLTGTRRLGLGVCGAVTVGVHLCPSMCMWACVDVCAFIHVYHFSKRSGAD